MLIGYARVSTNDQNLDLVATAKRELRGKVLGCWCAPLPCHGHVLACIADAD
jgi:hypothetical protein